MLNYYKLKIDCEKAYQYQYKTLIISLKNSLCLISLVLALQKVYFYLFGISKIVKLRGKLFPKVHWLLIREIDFSSLNMGFFM